MYGESLRFTSPSLTHQLRTEFYNPPFCPFNQVVYSTYLLKGIYECRLVNVANYIIEYVYCVTWAIATESLLILESKNEKNCYYTFNYLFTEFELRP